PAKTPDSAARPLRVKDRAQVLKLARRSDVIRAETGILAYNLSSLYGLGLADVVGKEVRMSVDVANRSLPSSPSVRALLDQAKAVEHENAADARVLVQQARVLARSQGDEAGEAEAFYRLASLAYYE